MNDMRNIFKFFNIILLIIRINFLISMDNEQKVSYLYRFEYWS